MCAISTRPSLVLSENAGLARRFYALRGFDDYDTPVGVDLGHAYTPDGTICDMNPERPSVYRTAADEHMYERSYLNPEEAHARALEKLAAYQISADGFESVYSAEELARDAATVERLKQKFGVSPAKKYGDLLEAVACEHGELSDWFGPSAQVMKTSDYDDFCNRVDMVVEIEEIDKTFSHLALGVDVTFGSRELYKKFETIKANIDAGRLGTVKYFRSDRQPEPRGLTHLPQVVLGIDIERVKELGLLWMNRRNKELGGHPVQRLILEEAALQLKTFAAYAERTGKIEIAGILSRELEKVEELLREKVAAGIPTVEGDKVFEAIKNNLAIFELQARAA